MGNRAPDWTLGWLKCDTCSYEWNAMVDDLPQYSGPVRDIVTQSKPFKASCPQCGQENCFLQEIMGV